MIVFVINKHGEALMPCSQRKARILLKSKKAKIINYKPFVIQLLYGSYGYKQPIKLGIDLGSKHIGVAIVSEDKVLAKGEIALRDDVKGNLESKKIYRRSRRNRKTRYRKARFQNRTSSKKEGWLPPSIQNRINNTFRWVDVFRTVLPNPALHIEVGKFDVQKMMNPSIEGKDYQQGQTFSYHDVRYFVFARDNYTCQVCKKKNKILNTHHIIYRSHGGSDRADNLITVCADCHTHENHQEGNVLWKWMQEGKKLPQYKETVFMNVIRRKVYNQYPDYHVTYGSVTTPHRKELGLEKSHYNDAIAISGISAVRSNPSTMFKIVQFRKKKRSLHEATARKGRKQKNITSKRNEKNTKQVGDWCLNDQVRLFGKVGWISGFSGKSAYVKDINGNYVTIPRKTYKQVSLSKLERICRNNNWQYQELSAYAD
ncbi:RNA-guided endonuclease IscB [Bacillus sp. XF8]|uniref:RNA-guided endonuclease IscB n=1 Tax=Bacillus sp. XF8 TaxID=2819289 RepID=UPI001AA03170|nr:RNA-guided endonuclease IscB [Bacillus sp. XF8]MBO1581972.1 HNH endonuclease [Bacillus sp. XF8]